MHICNKAKLETTTGSHRVHIALDELRLPYEQEIVDISKPRTAEYLKLNPRGLVPTLSYDGEILTESAIINTFLADTYSSTSTLLPASTDSDGPLTRAKISYFVDTYNRVQSSFMKAQKTKSNEDRASALSDFVNAAAKELDPLLVDAAPYFGSSCELTLAEVCSLDMFTLQQTSQLIDTDLDRFFPRPPLSLAKARPAAGKSSQ